MVYKTILKWLGLVALFLGLVYSVYHLGLESGFAQAETIYTKKIIKEQAKIDEQINLRNKLTQEYINEKQELKREIATKQRAVQEALDKSDDTCLSTNIPDDILNGLYDN